MAASCITLCFQPFRSRCGYSHNRAWTSRRSNIATRDAALAQLSLNAAPGELACKTFEDAEVSASYENKISPKSLTAGPRLTGGGVVLSGVGMTDIVVGRALWNDLVRQVAVLARDHHDGAAPVDTFLPRMAINTTIDNRWHSRAFKRAAMTHRLEDSTPLQSEVVGTWIRLTCNLYELKYNLGECGRSSRLTH